MKRRDWLMLALLGCSAPLPTLHAQDSRIIPVPPASGTRTDAVNQVEPGNKSAGKKETTSTAPLQESTTSTEEYQPSFSERMSDFRDWCFHPISFSWFADLAGANENMLPGDIEDPTWFKMDMLFGKFKGANTPPLLTTGTPQESRGIIGNDGTTILFGDSINLLTHYGFRATGGFWTEPTQSLGFEASYFLLFARNSGQTFSSKGGPLLAAPYVDALTGQQSSVPIANEALNDGSLAHLSGSADIGLDSRMQGAEVNVLQNLVRGTRGRIDWSWGYRYLRYDENLFNTVFQSQDPPVGQTLGTQTRTYDEFTTENEFQGINFALRSQWWWGPVSFDINGKLALGSIRNTVQVYGQTLTASPPQFHVVRTNGGIYALASNIGDQTFNRFSVAPEIELGIGYQVCDQVRMTVNYNFLALTNVMRVGDQVDNRINPNILNGNAGNPSVPIRLNETSTFWLQTFSFGVEYRW